MLTTVKPQPSSIVFNANPSLSSCLSSLQNFTTFLSFRLTKLHNFSFLTASLSFTLSKIHNFSFLTPNSLSSLLGLFLSSFNWITPSYLFNCHYTKKKKIRVHIRYTLSLPFVINILLFFQLIEHLFGPSSNLSWLVVILPILDQAVFQHVQLLPIGNRRPTALFFLYISTISLPPWIKSLSA